MPTISPSLDDGEALLYMTEEALKPLLNLRGLVQIGAAGTLATLRALGFQTFEGVVNETYDTILDAPGRVRAARLQSAPNLVLVHLALPAGHAGALCGLVGSGCRALPVATFCWLHVGLPDSRRTAYCTSNC